MQKPYSQDTAKLIDEEVRALVAEAYARTLALVTKEKAKVEALALGLLDKEVLQRHDLVEILGQRPWKYDGQQNIDILDQGFRGEMLGESASDEIADETASEVSGDSGKDDEPSVPAGAVPVAS
jgi:AFG3 family protein